MIKIVDAMCGQGKTSAAINYINASGKDEKFLFITPYLDEVKRIIDSCPGKKFVEPQERASKLQDIKRKIKKEYNIASTHALFRAFDKEIIEELEWKNYTLIIDEVDDVIEPYSLSELDTETLLDYTTVDDNNNLRWKPEYINYTGKFSAEKVLCELGALYYNGGTVLRMMPVELFTLFKDVIILTYRFDSQIQRCYYDLKGIEYEYMYVAGDRVDNYHFTSEKVDYKYPNYRSLITVLDNERMNEIGDDIYALSKTWYKNNTENLAQLKNNLNNYFRRVVKTNSSRTFWTTFKDYERVLKGNGYTLGFAPCNIRATNEYRDRTSLAYTINVFINPLVKNYLLESGVEVKEDDYALSELIQWVFRSAIRDGKPISIYIPSSRMRLLFENWLDEISGEGGFATSPKMPHLKPMRRRRKT